MSRRTYGWNRLIGISIVGVTVAAVLVHVAGWAAAISVLWRYGTLHVPPIQSAIALGLGLLTIRASSEGRRIRQLVVVGALGATLAAFVFAPLPVRFDGNGYMGDGAENVEHREKFEVSFPVAHGQLPFKAHLGDFLIASLDRAFGQSAESSGLAYATLSRLAGLLFVLELLVVATCYGWSRRACRFAGLAIAAPVSLFYFAYFETGYLALSVAVVPLLAIAIGRPSIRARAATLLTGSLLGLHSALHGFGLLGLAGATLASLSSRGSLAEKMLRTATLVLSGIALYLGWIFLYVVVMKLSIFVDSAVMGFGIRSLVTTSIWDRRIIDPLFSYIGLSEVGLASILAGVPLLVLAGARSSRAPLVATAAYGLPGLVFLIWWWSSPGLSADLDLVLAAFPGMFAALWLLARSSRNTTHGFALLVVIHVMFWSTIGGAGFGRVWIEASQSLH